MRSHIKYLLSFSAILFLASGCAKRTEEPQPEQPAAQAPAHAPAATPVAPPKSGDGLGVVKKISASRKFITLDHNDMPGIMEAMAMEYPVQSPELLKDIHVKDSVSFTLTKTPESQYMVTAIKKK
ncbi:MAG: copper-binding protein [Bacteroidota bacterium]|nr:copper-binding protein [Bacteroidota bacterium]MDP4231380.1 copper-binding protein [Bacteroidota bacterium]MDP4237796.1 copper-binding protein [Bacteroidota bacterium]